MFHLAVFFMHGCVHNSPRNICLGLNYDKSNNRFNSTTLCHDLCSEDSVEVQELSSLTHKSRHDALRVKRMLDRRFARED